MPPHVHIDFVVHPPPGYGRSVTDFWVWGAHGAQLRCPSDVSGDFWAWGARRGLKPKVYKLPRPRPPWGSSPIRENSHGRTGNRTQDLMSSIQEYWPPGHQAGHKGEIVFCIFNVQGLYFIWYLWPSLPPLPRRACERSVECSTWIRLIH
jgi:hypothetical protein